MFISMNLNTTYFENKLSIQIHNFVDTNFTFNFASKSNYFAPIGISVYYTIMKINNTIDY